MISIVVAIVVISLALAFVLSGISWFRCNVLGWHKNMENPVGAPTHGFCHDCGESFTKDTFGKWNKKI